MKRFICVLAVLLLLCSCNARPGDDPPPSADISEPVLESSVSEESPPSQSEPEPVPAPPAELRIPGEITVYQIRGDSGIFEPHTLPVDQAEITLFDIAVAVQKHLGATIPIKGITQRKGMVVVDISGSFVGSYSEDETEHILTTLAATLQQNHMSFEWIQYQLDGEIGAFGELWDIPPLKLVEGSAAEFAALRAKIPYEGLEDAFLPEKPILETDETGWRLTRFLAMLRLLDKDISSPAELDTRYVLETAIFATKHYTTDPMYTENYAPELKPLEAPASEAVGFFEDWFWLQEHVEQTAKLLYGDEFKLKHESFVKYQYHETLGVYTPPHMGGGYNVIPVIFSYEDLGDRYKIELTYIIDSMGGYFDPDNWDWEKPIAENNLQQYVQTTSKRREVILKKTGGGQLSLVSHQYIAA